MALYNIKRRVQKFDTDEQDDMNEYEEILNNPLCSIISSYKEKLTTKETDSDGNSTEDSTVIMVVTWEEKKLA